MCRTINDVDAHATHIFKEYHDNGENCDKFDHNNREVNFLYRV